MSIDLDECRSSAVAVAGAAPKTRAATTAQRVLVAGRYSLTTCARTGWLTRGKVEVFVDSTSHTTFAGSRPAPATPVQHPS
ncbi:hypothetical protein [Streptomyces sp. NPDC001478]